MSNEQANAWCPDVCPITGMPFFMWIEHHETGIDVPTYGGPFDSYTIPVRQSDGSYCRERYDHDRGGWLVSEVEDVGVQIVSDQAYVYDEEPETMVVNAQLLQARNEAAKWKAIAEFIYAKRAYPDQLELGQGALDAWANKWTGFEDAVAAEKARTKEQL